jgi:hypothetical protein
LASCDSLESDDAEVPRTCDRKVTKRPEIGHRTKLDVGSNVAAEQIVGS